MTPCSNIKEKGYEFFAHSELAELATVGVAPDPVIARQVGAITIVCELPQALLLAIEKRSQAIANCTPALLYGIDNAHATLGVCRQRDHFSLSISDEEGCRLAVEIVQGVLQRNALKLSIRIERLVTSRTTVRLEGKRNRGFGLLMRAIIHEAEAKNLPLIPPDHLHVTLSRFRQSARMSDELNSELSRPWRRQWWAIPAISVCTCTTDDESGFRLTRHCSFML